ncbi:hypothetical protein DFQ01_104249 [Paenibacillus cellulosilyticus]|uniref:Uncharacterized protein n=1 Tax=Paenibacillus cellulosilyticus TaxID=375489 RepID=A0A2V2YW71_9BACL|nr:hypothetical protein [Paenibacillus cellulosilyticus]PWW05687.1 hypothetical protein DFQ01_104249 [Paenibacillus cellulosilyticus]QKS45293.1 hypothetical protein HUB94_13355 [Paenibacillus cellulosilyticus]
MWSGIWFFTNILFVVSAITFLFAHRSVTEGRRMEVGQARLSASIRFRRTIGILAIVMFAAMALSFVINMKVNG